MSGNFWADKLGSSAPPPHVQPAPVQAWWAPTPASTHLQVPQQQGQYQDSPVQYTYDQLNAMRADEMSQEQMEMLAAVKLQREKYNNACPNCGSNNFIPQGTRVSTGTGTVRMGTDKCFECGASSSTLTGSPEPAVGATGSKANSHHTRQTANGGAASGNYGRHVSSLPTSYLPRS